jgi:hypothetical protein
VCGADDDAFWEGIRPVAWVDVPELQQQITVAGYPAGSDSMSITQGIVSRVVMSSYVSGAPALMVVQVCCLAACFV